METGIYSLRPPNEMSCAKLCCYCYCHNRWTLLIHGAMPLEPNTRYSFPYGYQIRGLYFFDFKNVETRYKPQSYVNYLK